MGFSAPVGVFVLARFSDSVGFSVYVAAVVSVAVTVSVGISVSVTVVFGDTGTVSLSDDVFKIYR